MQKTEINQAAKVNHRQLRGSTTLSRRYTKRPAKNPNVMVTVKKSAKIKHFEPSASEKIQNQQEKQMRQMQQISQTRQAKQAQQMNQWQQTRQMQQASQMQQNLERHPLQTLANDQMRARALAIQKTQNPEVRKPSAKELKDQAIKKALAAAANTDKEGTQNVAETEKVKKHMHFGIGRVALALSSAAVVVFAIVYFVNLNMPDISLRVAAMQTGIDSSYPNYVPRGYNASSITSEEGKVSLEFKNPSTGEEFSLIEEKSSWDTNALESNFVKSTYGENYNIIREQGITIYINGSNAVWVNGGIIYKIEAKANTLTNKQIRSIAVSL